MRGDREGSGRGPGAAPVAGILRNRRVRRVGAAVISLAIIAVSFAFVLPSFARYGQVGAELDRLSAAWIWILGAATVLNIITFAPPWLVVLPGLSFLAALRVTQASTALISVVPGGAPMGMAITFGMLRSQRVSQRAAAFAVALTGLWNQLAVFLFPVVALVLVAGEGSLPGPLEAVALLGVVLALAIVVALALALARASWALSLGELLATLATRLRRGFRRGPVSWGGETLVALRAEVVSTLARSWVGLSLTTLANQLTGYLMLDLSLRAVGIPLSELSVAETFAAWSIGRLIGSLPLTPSGIGFVELGLVGTLVGFGGHDAPVVAGVLLYRALIIFPTLVLGSLAGLTWRLRR